jgi:hypothetical protein
MNKRQQIKTLKCIQINLQTSKDSPSVLSDFIQSEDIDIAFIQEPYVIDHKICGFPLKLDIFYDKNCDLPKSAIILNNKSLKALEIKTFTTYSLNTVLIQLKDQNLCLFNVYCSPFADISNQLEDIQKAIDSLNPDQYIIVGDFNAHSQVWNNSYNDIRGVLVLDFISRNGLILLNDNSQISTYETIKGKSNIDLTLIISKFRLYFAF